MKTAIDSYSDHICQLEEMADEIKTFLEPMALSLDVLVFFQLHKSCLFEQYLTKCKDIDLVTTETDQRIRLNTTVLLTVAFLWRLCHGSATVSEVTFACSLCDINVEHEKESLKLFSESQVFLERFHEHKQECVGPDGISAVLELFQIKDYIPVIVEACQQVGLHQILSDPQLQKLENLQSELQSEDYRQNLTMTEAKNMLIEVEDILQIKTRNYQHIFELFDVIKDSGAFFGFAEEQKFTGFSGRNRFRTRHRIVTTELQHEQYNEKLLDHLLGCFEFVEPFLAKPSSLKELMERVTSLSNIPNGIKQLKTVNAGIVLVRHWFEVRLFSISAL